MDKNLMREALKHRIIFFSASAFGVLVALSILLQNWYIAKIIDGIFMSHADATALKAYFLWALALIGMRLFCEMAEDYFSLYLAKTIQSEMREAIVEKLSHLPFLKSRELQKGQTLNLLYEGIDSLEKYYGGFMPQLVKVALIPLMFLIVVFPKDWVSALIMLVTLPLIPIFMILIGKWTQKESVRQWVLLTRFTGYLQDVLAGLMTLKSLGQSQKQGEKINEISESYRKSTFSVQKWAFISSMVLELVATISIALVAVGLGVRLTEGMMNFFIAFYILLLIPEYYQPLRTLGQYFHSGINAKEASKSIYEFLALEELEETDTGMPLEHIESIRFENVTYRYPNASVDALKQINLSLQGNQSLAFIGESGSGKSTLMLLAAGVLEPSSGQILINDHPVAEWRKKDLLSRISVVMQPAYIFQGTVLENIAFSVKLSEEEHAKATEMALLVGLNQLLRTSADGLETILGQGGQEISGGQRALLLMARALYKDADILFFDEMTDNLDLETERMIIERMPMILKGRASWIIAHRLQTLKYTNHIYQLEQGEIVAEGNYHTMVESNRFLKQEAVR